jgi:hypothetical protein
MFVLKDAINYNMPLKSWPVHVIILTLTSWNKA